MRRGTLVATLLIAALALPDRAAADEATPTQLVEKVFAIFDGDATERGEAIDFLVARGNPDAAAPLILALRFVPNPGLGEALAAITGDDARKSWADWMLWQEAHDEVVPFEGFDKVHAEIHYRIDPNFQLFLRGGLDHDIRIEEIVWGGVRKDGIPALTHPRFLAPEEAAYLNGDDLVFGVEINGDARAYPLRILDWHEMFNDVVGGVPVSLAYCTLCGSGILYETTVEGYPKPLIFGSSGFLYRSNKLMYDTYTNSLWKQFTGKPVVGPLTGSGIELKTRPVVITRWADWLRDHPDTRVLDIDTGFPRDYSTGAAYSEYFASPDLMFPALVDESKLKQKSYVFALRSSTIEKAWPLALFEGGAVINDTAGALSLVLIGDAATRTIRAYRSDRLMFEKGEAPNAVQHEGELWKITEDALVGPDGRTLARLPGHIAYWFAWDNYFGNTGEVGGP
jgi:hypothetical protein